MLEMTAEAGGGEGFAGDAAEGIVGQAGVEDGVGNLVGNFVGVTFSHGFRRKKISVSG